MSLNGAISNEKAVRPSADRMRAGLGTESGTNHASVLLLAMVLVSALALRLYRLDSGLWLDEIFTYVNYARLPFAEIATTYESKNQHVLYSLLAHASFLVFGESAWALRVPSVLFGVASIGALYLLGLQVGTRTEALLASALLAFSYHHIWFSQNARGYSGLLFWALASSWLLLKALRSQRRGDWLLYAVSTALGMYTNMAMVFVVISHLAMYVLAMRLAHFESEQRGTWFQAMMRMSSGFYLGFGVAVLLTLLLYAPIMERVLWSLRGEVSNVQAWTSPLWALQEFARGIAASLGAGRALLAAIVGVSALGVFYAGMRDHWLQSRQTREVPHLLHLFWMPVVLCAVVTIALGHHLWPRLFYFAYGFGALIVVRGCIVVGNAVAARIQTSLRRSEGRAGASGGIALAILLVAVSALSIPPVYGPKQDYEGALRYVQANRKPGDAVAVVGLASFPLNEFYHAGLMEIETVDALEAVRAEAQRVWVVYTFPPEAQAVYPQVMAVVERDFTVVQRFYGTVGSGTVFVCLDERPAASSSGVGALVGRES